MTHQTDMARAGAAPHHAGARALAITAHYALNYHPGTLNYCPGCAGTHWLIGRTTAQCARCETALPLAQGMDMPIGPLISS